MKILIFILTTENIKILYNQNFKEMLGMEDKGAAFVLKAIAEG